MKKSVINIAIAAVLSLSFLTVQADGKKDKPEKDSNKEMLTKVINTFEEGFDLELNFENWMTELTGFDGHALRFNEPVLDMEEWMTEIFAYTNTLYNINFQESELEFENWMMENFDNTGVRFQDEKLEMESWMTRSFETNTNSFDQELEFEAWMFNTL